MFLLILYFWNIKANLYPRTHFAYSSSLDFAGSCFERSLTFSSSQTRLAVCQCPLYISDRTIHTHTRNSTQSDKAKKSSESITPPYSASIYPLCICSIPEKNGSFMTQQILCNINISGGEKCTILPWVQIVQVYTHIFLFMLNLIHYSLHLHPSKNTSKAIWSDLEVFRKHTVFTLYCSKIKTAWEREWYSVEQLRIIPL